MAKQLKKYEWTNSRVGQSTYNWTEWLNGQIWSLTHGESGTSDFQSKPDSFIMLARATARKAGKVLRVEKLPEDKGVVLQAMKASEEQLAKWAAADAKAKAKKAQENGQAEE